MLVLARGVTARLSADPAHAQVHQTRAFLLCGIHLCASQVHHLLDVGVRRASASQAPLEHLLVLWLRAAPAGRRGRAH